MAFPVHNYYRQTPLAVDTHPQNYFEDDEGSILDENILDSALDMSPPMDDSRRDSFAMSAALFSPKTDDWAAVDMQSVPSNNNNNNNGSSNTNNPFGDPSNNPFLRIDAPSAYAWPMANSSGMSTPMPGSHHSLPADFDPSAPIFQRPMQSQSQTQASFGPVGSHQLPLFSPANTSNSSIPPSPQKEWSVAEAMDHRAMPKRMRPHSPALRSHTDMTRRGDGIRKKNARFDIPAERNLTNIDQLIAQSNDEQEIKELKQQKRLLRNRQAA